VYYECYGKYCCEALNFPLRDLHRKYMQGFKAIFFEDRNVGMFPKRVGNRPLEVVRRIEEYTNLDLTNHSDILKGILSVLNAFERKPINLHHHLGVPILPQSAKKAWPIGEDWTSVIGFFCGLFWNPDERSARRPRFPSWF
jgi:hypothetical protein